MKKTIISLFVIIASAFLFKTYAQQLHLSAGIGSYSMGNLRNQIESSKKRLPVEAKIFNDFPPYFNYHIALRWHNNPKTTYFETELGFFSTGSRLNHIDYSGELNIDFLLSSIMTGFEMGTYLNTMNKLNYGFYHQLSYYTTFLKIEEKIRLGNESESYSSGIRLSHLAIEAGFFGVYNISDRFSLSSSIGYSQQLVTLERASRKPDWSGIRFEVGLIYTSNVTKSE